MKMELPSEFLYAQTAQVKNNNLYIYNFVRYEDLIYELTYSCKQSNCIYCGKKLTKFNRTVDHRYPRHTGGISIVDNLFPCCSKCNSEKGDLTHEEYLHLISLPTKLEKKDYRKSLENQKERILKDVGFILPQEWVQFVNIAEVQYKSPLEILIGKKYIRAVEHYEKYHNLWRPAIIDQNYNLLDGYNIILFAKNSNIQTVPIIRLKNVCILNQQ